MKRTTTRVLSLLLALCLIVGLLPIMAFAEETMSGSCGATENDTVTWALTQNNESEESPTYTLTISGTGAMEDYGNAAGQPWNSYETSITKVEINSGITHLGGCVFQGFSSITSVVIPDSVTSLGKQVFKKCTSLANITLPDTITTLGDSVFQNTAITEMALPEGLTTAGIQLFYSCTSLKEVTLPDSLVSLDQSAFSFSTALEKVTFGNGLTEIPYQTFLGCTSLKTVVFPTNLTSIGRSAFYNSGIEEIVIPDGVTEIGSDAFRGCSQLKSITIPNSVTTIGNNAIRECTALESIVIPDSVVSIGETALCGSISLKCIVLGKGLQSLSTTFVFADIEFPLIYAANDVNFNANPQSKIIVARTNGGTFETVPTNNSALATPQKLGYEFGGWYNNEACNGAAVTATEKGQTYYAKWMLADPAVALNADKTSIVKNRGAAALSAVVTNEADSVIYTYQWYVGGIDELNKIDGATEKTYTVTGLEADTTYFCKVTAKDDATSEVTEATSDGLTICVTEAESGYLPILRPPVMPVMPGLPFRDVDEDDWYYDAVVWAREAGVTGGTSATAFSPNALCTRAQMVSFLWRAAGCPAPRHSENPFRDVSICDYYYDAVLWVVEQGITNGTSATTFSPDAAVTRGQTVAFLYRANGSPAAGGGSFADVPGDAYYADAVRWAVANGVTNGTGAKTFSPDADCTRAQIVTFLYRCMAN